MFKTRNRNQPSKKMSCPAQFAVKKLLYFPGYEVAKSSSKWKQDEKKKSLKKKLMSLKNSIIPSEEEEDVDFVVARKKRKVGVEEKVAAVLNYITIFPPMSDHQFHHQGEAAGLIEPLDERVREYIKKLVRGGVRRKADILSRTKEYVNEEIFQGLSNPDRLRRRFKPDPHTIRNIIACVRYETRYSKFDQENVMELKKKWEADANVKFIPKGSAPKLEEILDKFDNENLEWDDVDDIEEIPLTVNIEVDSKLCFVYQSKHMQRLYRMYGKHLVLLDATHKVCKYSLPLFFLVVQTNVNF